MIPDLKPYPEYKEAGLHWPGTIPSEWNILRAKSIFDCIDIRSETGSEELLTVSSNFGVIPRRNIKVTMFKAESYVGYKLCWPGDLVINSLWAWMTGLGFSRHHGIVSSAYGVYRPKEEYARYWPYFDYLFRSKAYDWELRVRSKGIWTSRLQLTDGSFLDMPVILPPPENAKKIVIFLDCINRLTNRYIRLKLRQIELLNEQKQAIIHQAVTRGLDPNMRLKPSGVEWLGDVPEHWELKRLRNAIQLIVSNVDKHTHEGEKPIRLCNYVDVYKNESITSNLSFMSATATEEEIARFRLKIDDVVITKDSEIWNDIGVPALIEYESDDFICGYHLAILRPFEHILIGSYLQRILQSRIIATQFHVAANGVTRYGISHQAIKDVRIPIPPLPEQKDLVVILNKELLQQIQAIEIMKQEINLLREYRIRLISDVVTGKLDVHGAELPALKEEEVFAPEADLEANELGKADEMEGSEEMSDADD